VAPIFGLPYNTVYDTVYYSLTVASTLLLVYATFLGFKKRHNLANPTYRNQALGIALAALGFAITISGGVFLDILTKRGIISDLLFQQSHFSILYIGLAMILFGIDASLLTAQKLQSLVNNLHVKQQRIFLWSIFIATTAISVFFLFTLSAGPSQHVSQQLVFYLPIIFVILAGIIELPVLAIISKKSPLRKHLTWFSLSLFLILVGALREATIIPSSGEPLIDLLVGFGPFTAASICLYLSIRSLKF
jgi:hypothetical protein